MYVVLHKMLHPFILTERCPKRLAQAASLGVYIAFSTFLDYIQSCISLFDGCWDLISHYFYL